MARTFTIEGESTTNENNEESQLEKAGPRRRKVERNGGDVAKTEGERVRKK